MTEQMPAANMDGSLALPNLSLMRFHEMRASHTHAYHYHSTLYLQRASTAPAGQSRPTTSLKGGTLASATGIVHGHRASARGSKAKGKTPCSPAKLAHAISSSLTSQDQPYNDLQLEHMAAQLLKLAGYPVVSSLRAGAQSSRPSTSLACTSTHMHGHGHSQHGSTSSTSAFACLAADQGTPRDGWNRRASSTQQGWSNSLGDTYDGASWHRRPFEPTPEEQTPRWVRVVRWHARHLKQRAWRCWHRYLSMRRGKAAKLQRVKRHADLSLERRAVQALCSARAHSVQLARKICRVESHWTRMMMQRALAGWAQYCGHKYRQRCKRQQASRAARGMLLHRTWAAWRSSLAHGMSSRAITSWACHRMALSRKHAVLTVLQQNVVRSQRRKRMTQRAEQLSLSNLLHRCWLSWQWVVARSRHRRLAVERAQRRSTRRLLFLCFFAWNKALQETKRHALTEQVYDLKRELQYAVAWSD